jgi:hypothetical protein
VQQAEATVVKGLQWYNTNVLNKDKKK